MSREWKFQDKRDFLSKLEELIRSGVPPEDLSVITPFPVHEAEHLLHPRPSRLKFFALGGALLGMLSGFGLTILTSLDWPLMTGGKPIVSLPPYIIIAFELTILFGGVITFLGFLRLSRMPDIPGMLHEVETGNDFIIRQNGEVRS